MKLLNTALIPFILLFSCQQEEQQSFTRHIELEGQVNFRDLGNYQTESGAMVRPGMVYRSGSLNKLTTQDLEILQDLGIRTVISFLTQEEISKLGEDQLPEEVQYYNFPIYGQGDEINDLIQARETGDFSAIPSDINAKFHRMVTETGKEAYSDLFEILSNSESFPLVFHCSHGVHRTGTASALLLNSLGIPWSTIEEDYMLSNTYRGPESRESVSHLDSIARFNDSIPDKDLNRKYIESFFFLQKDYINGTRIHILEQYGSFDEYYSEAGISENTRGKIESILLSESETK